MADLEKLIYELEITEENTVAETDCEGLSQEVRWVDLNGKGKIKKVQEL